MKHYKTILLACIILIIFLLLHFCNREKPEFEPTTETKDTSKITHTTMFVNGTSRINYDTTKILTYDYDTYINTCSICQKNINDSGWKSILIEESSGFFSRIRINNNKKISELDMVVHSIPGKFGTYFDMDDICMFADRLKEYIDVNTIIYLNGCNTGVRNRDYATCIGMSSAQRLANLTGCTVYGSKGYLKGSYAENNESCTSHFGSYSVGGSNGSGRGVWEICNPSGDHCTCTYSILTGTPLYARLMNLSKNKMNLKSNYNYPIRPFPDFKFIINGKKGFKPVIYYVYVLEELLYDQKTKSIYPFKSDDFHSLVDSLFVYAEME